MKISGSNMVFSSENQFEQMDLSLEEKTEEISFRQNPGQLNDIRNRKRIPGILELVAMSIQRP